MSLSMPPDEFDLVKRVNAFVEAVKDLPGVVVGPVTVEHRCPHHEWEGCACGEADEAEYLRGRADERDAIIAIASQLRATIPADHPKGAQASFADYLQVTREATP